MDKSPTVMGLLTIDQQVLWLHTAAVLATSLLALSVELAKLMDYGIWLHLDVNVRY